MSSQPQETDDQAYYRLLRQAFDASEAVDMFDLYSEDPASAARWSELRAEEVEARMALTAHILDNYPS